MRSTSILAACLALASTARADLLCHATNTSVATTNWNTTLTIPRFDPALGTLNLVDVCVTGWLFGTYSVESLESAPTTWTGQPAAIVSLLRPNQSLILSAHPLTAFVDNLAAFDGTIDFRGTSGVMHTGLNVATTSQLNLVSAPDLALFTGAAGNPGSLMLPITGVGAGIVTGPGHCISQFITQAQGMISICYDYTPVAVPSCAGDGAGTACPCGNSSPVGALAGCLNSVGVGAALRGTGTASVTGDTLTLQCTNVPAVANGMLIQGTSQLGAGSGIVFGDGLRCVGGAVMRMGIKTATSGVLTYPEAGDVPLSVRGSVAPNTTLHYQVWYRNSANYCTSATFNLSNMVTVGWTP